MKHTDFYTISQMLPDFRGDLRMEKKPDRSEIIAMTLLFALTLVLTVLKVTRTVSLPWLWVLGPLWLGTYRYRD